MSKDYKGIIIPNEVIFVVNKSNSAFVVDAQNEQTLKTARNWARGWLNDFEPEEYKYKNGEFELYIKNASENSWNGGKLSFWTCTIICPDGKEFDVGVNSELLCDLILHTNFEKGKCDEKLFIGRVKNQCGLFTKNMPNFEQAIKEKEMKEIQQSSKYEIGDGIKTLTSDEEFYLGTIYKNFDYEYKYEAFYCWNYDKKIAINVFEKPKKIHVFGRFYNGELKISCLMDSKPKRIITGNKINFTEEEKEKLFKEYVENRYYSGENFLGFKKLQYSLESDRKKTTEKLLKEKEKLLNPNSVVISF